MPENELAGGGFVPEKMLKRLYKPAKIAVVCPTYNSADYIARTLDTLLSQQEIPEEVIFSDDGSDDNTVGIIEQNRERFRQRGIELKVLCNPHEGPGAARNHGIMATELSWISFLDADDIWKPEKLKEVRQAINRFPESNCFLHWEKYIRADGRVTDMEHGKNFDNKYSLSKQLYNRNFFSTSAVVCRKSLLSEVEYFDVSLPNGQDYDLWLKMSTKVKITIISSILGSYYEEATSITARPYYKRFFSDLRIAWRHRDKGSSWLLYWKLFRIIISKQWFFTLRNLIQKKKSHSW